MDNIKKFIKDYNFKGITNIKYNNQKLLKFDGYSNITNKKKN